MLGLQSYTSYIYSYVPSWESTTSSNHVIIISWTIGHKMMITVPRKGSFNKSTTSRITNVGPKPSRRWSENDWSDLISQSFWWSNCKRSLITTLTKSDQHFPACSHLFHHFTIMPIIVTPVKWKRYNKYWPPYVF